jgi:uncharacterized BrkB/YihY/UPF0761 family membrane protein
MHGQNHDHGKAGPAPLRAWHLLLLVGLLLLAAHLAALHFVLTRLAPHWAWAMAGTALVAIIVIKHRLARAWRQRPPGA